VGGPDSGALVLDAGALIALEKARRPVEVLLRRARDGGRSVVIPAGVVAQVWRRGDRQVRLAQLLRTPQTDVESLDEGVARLAGALCGLAGTDDVVDATVVIAARRHDALVVSSDEADLRRLDPGVRVHAL
jgi:hypothetical protein